jgi:diaminohydroxyphosphoribosylaminopyrimidine deaminase/5-amino-6-(5-phosphoribosylamino)uracil reductase
MKQLVHQWRTEESAVLVGTRTAYNDDPRLTVREWAGRNPLRIIIDEHLSLPRHLKLFDQSTPTLVLTSKEKLEEHNLSFLQLDFKENIIPQFLDILYQRGIQSLLVEGGKELLDSFIAAGLWDEIRVLEGNKHFGKGLPAPDFKGVLGFEERFGDDFYRCFYR